MGFVGFVSCLTTILFISESIYASVERTDVCIDSILTIEYTNNCWPIYKFILYFGFGFGFDYFEKAGQLSGQIKLKRLEIDRLGSCNNEIPE